MSSNLTANAMGSSLGAANYISRS